MGPGANGWPVADDPYEPLRAEVRRFYADLGYDSDIVAVLRGHLYIEAVLTELITMKYAGAETLVRWLDFRRKILVGRDSGLIEGVDRTALQALGELRDSFAHLPMKDRLTSADDEAMRKSITGHLAERYDIYRAMQKQHATPDPGSEVRAAMLTLYEALFVRLALKRQDREMEQHGAGQ